MAIDLPSLIFTLAMLGFPFAAILSGEKLARRRSRRTSPFGRVEF